MFTFTLKVSNKHTVISSSFATVFALSPWIIKSLHQVAWDNLPLSSQKLVYYREPKHQRRRPLQIRYLKKKVNSRCLSQTVSRLFHLI